MRKILAVIGRPGVGKTTLFKNFIESKNWENKELIKLVPSLYNEELDLHILGKYEEGEVFAGTDRMSMCCQPSVVEFITSTKSNIIFEGDRLTNSKFFDFLFSLKDTHFEIYVIDASDTLLTERYNSRGSTQSIDFLKGRKTKIDNIRKNMDYMDNIQVFNNNTFEHQTVILNSIKEFFNV